MRKLLVTSKKVYNLDPNGNLVMVFSLFNSRAFIKREIPIELITAISISTESGEFVLHIPK